MFNNNKTNNPAKYNKRVSFERYKKEQNDFGHWEEGWVTDEEIGGVWAQIRHIRGNEFIMAGAHNVKVTARINIRYRPDILESESDLRINFNDRIFEIIYMNNLEEKNIEIEILANEVRS